MQIHDFYFPDTNDSIPSKYAIFLWQKVNLFFSDFQYTYGRIFLLVQATIMACLLTYYTYFPFRQKSIKFLFSLIYNLQKH